MPIYPADAPEHNEEVWEKYLAEIVKCPSQAIGPLVFRLAINKHTYKTEQIWGVERNFKLIKKD